MFFSRKQRLIEELTTALRVARGVVASHTVSGGGAVGQVTRPQARYPIELKVIDDALEKVKCRSR
jgi:hypothetical protein